MEEYTIPEQHYKKIAENSKSLNISTNIIIIINKFNQFLIDHKKRRNFGKDSKERLGIEKNNRKFLEDYYKVYELIMYWYAYYLDEGIGGSEDKDKAPELYKAAADEGIAWAQLRYAFSLRTNNVIKDEDIPTFIKYLNQSAKNGNSIAQSNLGYIYFYGKFNIPVDNEKGKKLLILAAKKNDAKAIKLCNKERINYLDVTDEKIY
ncbi:16244_t:CDS:1 [Gigaspora margarita]|uniref:16244_t:CDS:1 n=1 Tax=Gigaspora margarita TaxID=4874 RepID=A0ABN7W904_GIGMA|nr:16244_t:CDS:1 [Gigaspora margarita]